MQKPQGSLLHNLFRDYILPKCALDKSHEKEQMTLICTDEKCKRKFEACCPLCCEQNHKHASSSFVSAMMLLNQLVREVESSCVVAQSEQKLVSAEEFQLIQLKEKFRSLAEMCYRIAANTDKLLYELSSK